MATASSMMSSLKTLSLTSTTWTTTTTFVEAGIPQYPVVTIYSSFQPIEWASYPDPVMSATGADLARLLLSKHSKEASLSLFGAANTSPSIVSIASTTAQVDSAFETSAAFAYVDTPNATVETPTSSIQSAVLPTSVSQFSQFTVTVTVTSYPTDCTPSKSIEDMAKRQASTAMNTNPATTPPELQESIWPKRYQQLIDWLAALDGYTSTMIASGLVVLVFLLIQLIKMSFGLFDTREMQYTSKPPRPGLRKRLSLSVHGRRFSNPSEATHVSGNASVGRINGKEARRASKLEV